MLSVNVKLLEEMFRWLFICHYIDVTVCSALKISEVLDCVAGNCWYTYVH
jgi:hypothetical protein